MNFRRHQEDPVRSSVAKRDPSARHHAYPVTIQTGILPGRSDLRHVLLANLQRLRSESVSSAIAQFPWGVSEEPHLLLRGQTTRGPGWEACLNNGPPEKGSADIDQEPVYFVCFGSTPTPTPTASPHKDSQGVDGMR